MIVPSGAVRVLVATRPVDFRKGMDGLAALVRESLGSDPYSGVIYQASRSREAVAVGRDWPGAGCQAAGEELVSLAADQRRRDASDILAALGAA
jgi:transposase